MKSYEELEKENAELKRQLEERQIIYEPIANEIIEILQNIESNLRKLQDYLNW